MDQVGLNRSIENSISSFIGNDCELFKAQQRDRRSRSRGSRKSRKKSNGKNEHGSEEPAIRRVNHFLNIVYSQAHLVEKLMKVNYEFNESKSLKSQSQISEKSSTQNQPLGKRSQNTSMGQ
jgi:hypothetical protein